MLVIAGCTPEISDTSVEAPIVDFIAAPLEGKAPQTVTFTAILTGDTSSYYWDFGDGTSSKERDPGHIYNKEGIYTVILVVNGVGGIGVEKKEDYITIIGEDNAPVNEVVDWRDACNYIGESKTVEGVIRDAYYASTKSSRPTFLNFNKPYKGYFTCVIWGSDRSKFVNIFHSSPESYLLNKTVQVTGDILEYPEGSGIPEMILKEPSQITIMNSNN
jgi:PKD repeat protein